MLQINQYKICIEEIGQRLEVRSKQEVDLNATVFEPNFVRLWFCAI